MTDPWNFAGAVAQVGSGGGTVTLVDESTFAISGATGDIHPGTVQGLFFRDTRFLDHLEVTVNGVRTEPLTAVSDDPFSCTFVMRSPPPPGRADSTVMLFRRRWVGQGLREDVTVHNYGDEASYCSIDVRVGADFASLFAVKEGRAGSHAAPGDSGAVTFSAGTQGPEFTPVTAGSAADTIRFERRGHGLSHGVEVRFGQPVVRGEGLATYEAIVPPNGEWTATIVVAPVIDGTVVEPRYRRGQPVEQAAPAERLATWRRRVPQVDTDHAGLKSVVMRSSEDLGALRIFDPDFPDRVVVAAGAPWFMTVFGRDSLISAWMALIVDPDLALGVLQTLARFQGTELDPRRDEQPGRILHEMRFGESASLSLGSGNIYYGTADATPLFVMLLGELRRWGVAQELVDELLPNAERAIEWIERYGDVDGDGYVEYQRATDRGLVNQGWKDSWDGIRFADGEVAKAPIALCEVQAYVYGAYLARAHFAFEADDLDTYQRYRARAHELKEAFNRDFWLEEEGWFAVGLDADKRPIDSLTSNIGHCLWTGIVDEDKARRVVEHLMSDRLWTGWGIRTLAEGSGGFNPISYHCGSVWPHDTAIVAAGLQRYGYHDEATRVVMGLLDAAVAQGGRLPELFSGLARGTLSVPVGYPTSCSPQAWAAASPLLCLRILLRLDPWIPYGKTWISPDLPEEIGYLKVAGIPLGGARVTIEAGRDVPGGVAVTGMPEGIELVAEPRQPLSRV